MGWNSIGMRYKGRPKNTWRNEVIDDLKKLKVKKYLLTWSNLVS
jgi:hypothetical protein